MRIRRKTKLGAGNRSTGSSNLRLFFTLGRQKKKLTTRDYHTEPKQGDGSGVTKSTWVFLLRKSVVELKGQGVGGSA